MIANDPHPWTPKLFWWWLPSLLGGLIWWYVISFVFDGRLAISTSALPTLLLFVVFGLFSFALWVGALVNAGYVTGAKSVRLAGAGLVTLPLMIFFPLTGLTIGVLLFTWLVLWWASERFVQDAHSRLQVKPHLSAGWALPVIVTLLMIGVSALYYQQLRGTARTPEELGARLSNQAVTIIERFLPTIYSDFNPDMTVDELVSLQIPDAATLLEDINFDGLTNASEREAALRERLGGIEGFSSEDISVDPTQTREELETELEQELAAARLQISANLREGLSEQFQIPIQGNDRVHDVLVNLVNKQYERYVSAYVDVVPWILALGLFFVLKIFAGVFLFTTTWDGWILVWLYRKLHIVHITHENAPAERMGWGK